jgi:hypothetical protein
LLYKNSVFGDFTFDISVREQETPNPTGQEAA